MSVNQSVLAYYGWKIPTSKAVAQWAAELDYELPEGVRLIGMDSTEVVFGVMLYESGSYRWGPMEGDDVDITQVDMHRKFSHWFHNAGGGELVRQFSDASWGQDKLHIFIDTF